MKGKVIVGLVLIMFFLVSGFPTSVFYRVACAELVINQPEYVWYGDFVVNETDFVRIENCRFSVVGGSIYVDGSLEVWNSTIHIQEAAAFTKYIYMNGSMHLHNSSLLGCGVLFLFGKSAGAPTDLVFQNSLSSWFVIDRMGYATQVEISESSVLSVELGAGVSGVSLLISDSEVSELLLSMPNSAGPSIYFDCEISGSHIERFVLVYTDNNYTGMHRGLVDEYNLYNGFTNLTITTTTVDSWSVGDQGSQPLKVIDSEVDLILAPVSYSSDYVNLTLATGFLDNCNIYVENVIDATIQNSTVYSWSAYLNMGRFCFTNSNVSTLQVLPGCDDVLLINSTFSEVLKAYATHGNLTMIDSIIDQATLSYNQGEMEFVLNPGYQAYLSLYNSQDKSNVTLLRTTVASWRLMAHSTAVFHIHDSTLKRVIPDIFWADTTLVVRNQGQVYVENSTVDTGYIQGNASLTLNDSTLGTLYAYENSNMTAVNSTIGTIVRDPPIFSLINSHLSCDILLSFALPGDMMSVRLLEQYSYPTPSGLQRFTQYLYMNTRYPDTIDAQVRMYYNVTEVEGTGIAEQDLRIFFLNTSCCWQPCVIQGVNNADHYVWANQTEFSCFVVGFYRPVHGVSLSGIVVSKTVVGKGYCAIVNVRVSNVGLSLETFTTSFYLNDTLYHTWNGALMSGDSATLPLILNTTTLQYGNYTLWAYADPVPDEANTLDNNYTCNLQVHVGVPGDISGPTPGVYDDITNMRDIGYLILLFTTNPGSPNWNPNADINDDHIVNMRDIGIACNNFMKT